MPNESTVLIRSFVDTNVFIYAQDLRDASKHNVAKDLLRKLSDEKRLVISTQVLNEICAVLLRNKVGRNLSVKNVQEIVDELYVVAEVHSVIFSMTKSALFIVEQHQLSWYDALILAAAIETDCKILYSEDFQSGRQIEGVTLINPFALD